MDKEERRLMALVHTQTPVGGQHANLVETRIKLKKRYCFNLMNKAKGEKIQPISMLQSDIILASGVSEVNNIPLFRHERYVYLTPQMLVNPMLEMSLATFDKDVMIKYYDALQPYLQMIADLRFDCFIKYVGDKRAATHSLIGQGTEIPNIGKFCSCERYQKVQLG